MIDGKSVTAIIPVRAGSRRLKNKNILPFADSNLLVHKIRQLKAVAAIDQVVVSSDSDIMLNMAMIEGATIHKRPLEYCDEKTKPFSAVVEYISRDLTGDILVWAPCVSPLVSVETYSDALEKYVHFCSSGGIYDSLISTKLFKEYLWNETGPLNYVKGDGHVPSQQLPEWKTIVNGFYIADRVNMTKWRYIYNNPYLYILSKKEGVDIDDAEDFEVAKALLSMGDGI